MIHTARPRIIIYSYLFGIAFMLAGLFCATVTIAGNDYTAVLRWGALFAALSALCLGIVVVRGSWKWRVAAVVGAIPLAFVILEVGLRLPFESRFARVESYLAQHQALLGPAVTDLTSIYKPGMKIPIEMLPPALAAPGVSYASCGESNVSLVLYHNPDTTSGFRVWNGKPGADYADEATTLPGVTRYAYCNDFPTSPSNRPN